MTTLLDLLHLDRPERFEFIGANPPDAVGRVFGGQVIAQALMAAGTTVEPGREVHSLHCYFLLAGDPGQPIIFRVNPIRDGRSYTTRRVVAEQQGREIFAMTTSLAVPEKGLQHQVLAPPGLTGAWPSRPGEPVADPETLTPLPLEDPTRDRSCDLRLESDHADEDSPSLRIWARLLDELPDDPLHQACALAYTSDMVMMPTAMLAHRIGRGTGMVASLDHAMWFHHPFHANEWLLHETDSPAASNGRAITRGQVFDRRGLLVASTAQEGVIRRGRENP